MSNNQNNPQEVPQVKSVEEIQNERQISAETIIKREADRCAKETKTRTSWDEQLIEVQYMITGSMIEFSDIENKELQSRIAELEAREKLLTETLLNVRDRHTKAVTTYQIITKALRNEK